MSENVCFPTLFDMFWHVADQWSDTCQKWLCFPRAKRCVFQGFLTHVRKRLFSNIFWHLSHRMITDPPDLQKCKNHMFCSGSWTRAASSSIKKVSKTTCFRCQKKYQKQRVFGEDGERERQTDRDESCSKIPLYAWTTSESIPFTGRSKLPPLHSNTTVSPRWSQIIGTTSLSAGQHPWPMALW